MANSFTTSFEVIKNGANPFSRRWGSNNASSAVDPYITGYCFVKFKHFPSLSNIISESDNPALSNEQAVNVLTSLVSSVTIPGATLNKAEFSGLGGIKWFYPTNADWDNTITMKFREMAGAPVHAIIHSWVKRICDYRAGIMRTDNSSTGGSPTKSDFTSSMYYWTTRPDGRTLNYHSLATGMFPTKDPTDMFGHDIEAIDKLELDIDFSLDVLYHEKFTYDACYGFANDYANKFSTDNILKYGKDDEAAGYGTEATTIIHS